MYKRYNTESVLHTMSYVKERHTVKGAAVATVMATTDAKATRRVDCSVAAD
jgi:hypothetical protein